MKKLLFTLFLALGSSLFTLCQAQYVNLHNFGNGTDGTNPPGSLIQAGNVLYGVTPSGGVHSDGMIFSIHKDGTKYKDLFDFSGANGSVPGGSLVLAGGVLYGMTQSGGAKGYGDIFSIDTNGTRFKDRWDFDGGGDTNGSAPDGCSLIVSGRMLYGMTTFGGKNKYGNIFSIDTNGIRYKDRWDFNVSGGTNGTYPYGTLLLVAKTLYAMTYSGGTNSYGNVFSIDTNGTSYKDIWNFDDTGTNGQGPQGNVILIGKKLYGMTKIGGKNRLGNIFSVDTNGIAYQNRWSFNIGGDTNGTSPYGSLILAGKNVLFGMTLSGGRHSEGNIFGIDTNGTKYSDIMDFDGSDGEYPYGSLLFSGSSFYGMTEYGGTYNGGVVFNDTIINLKTSDTSISCNGDNNGHATAYVQGIATPYTYSWTGGKTTDKITGLSAGAYTVTVTDNDGFTLTAGITITQPTALSISMSSVGEVLCNGSTGGAISNAATGGTPSYTYNWTPSGGTGLTANSLSAGIYTITATDKNGCTATASADVTQPAALTVSTYTSPDTNNYHNGVAAVNVTGGTQPYTYLWSPLGQTTDSISKLGARQYCCAVTDNHGCTDTVCMIVTLDTTTGIASISNASSISVYPDPNNGQFTIASSVASGQSSVEIYNVLGERVYSQLSIIHYPLSINLSNLPDGIYLVRILNQDGSLVTERKIIKTQ